MARARRKISIAETRHRDDLDAEVEVRRHPAARRLTLRVSCTRRAVVVTIPFQCDFDEAGQFLNRHIDWVKERLNKLPHPVPFAAGTAMPLRGVPHAIVSDPASKSRIVKRKHNDGSYPQILIPGDPALLSKRLSRWLMDEARRDLEVCVGHYATQLAVRPKRIAVRDQSSRWGSCSTTRVLSFSWRLIMAPPHVLDYVAAHEVAHLREMNHGPKFWSLVNKVVPDMDAAKEWLQVYGPDLHRYGSA